MAIVGDLEEPGEAAAIIPAQQIQPLRILHLSSPRNDAEIEKQFLTRRQRNGRTAWKGGLLSSKGQNYGKRRERRPNAGFAISLLLSAAVCAAHLLRTSTTNSRTANNHIGTLRSHLIPLPSPLSSLRQPNFVINQWKAAQIVSERLWRFSERLEQQTRLGATEWGTTPFGWLHDGQHLHMNILLAERRRRNAQRQRSPTPIPAPLPLPTFNHHHQRQQQQQPSSAPSFFLGSPPSTSSTSFGLEDFPHNRSTAGGDEPTLMDYDAIDAYWRWDIDQEKSGGAGTMSSLLPANVYGASPVQHHQYFDANTFPTDNNRYSEPTEILFERDMQLLTEKSFIPVAHNIPEDFSVIKGFDAEENLLENFSQHLNFEDGNDSKWLPQSSSTKQTKLIPFSSSAFPLLNYYSGDGTELPNIPVATQPHFFSELEQWERQDQIQGVCTSSSSPSTTTTSPVPNVVRTSGSISPLSSQSSEVLQQPILFNDVSLAQSFDTVGFADRSDEEDEQIHQQIGAETSTSSSTFAHHPSSSEQLKKKQHFCQQNSISNPLFADVGGDNTVVEEEEHAPFKKQQRKSEENNNNNNKEEEKEEADEDEAETEMLLSALFPQLFSPIPQASPNNNIGSFPMRSASLSSLLSEGSTVDNADAILRELAVAEAVLLNSSQIQQNLLLAQQLAPIANAQQQNLMTPPFSPLSIPAPLPLAASIGPLSPMLEHFNQTLTNGSPTSSSAATFQFGNDSSNSFALFGSPLSLYCNNTSNAASLIGNNFQSTGLALSPAEISPGGQSACVLPTLQTSRGSSIVDSNGLLIPKNEATVSAAGPSTDGSSALTSRFEQKLVPTKLRKFNSASSSSARSKKSSSVAGSGIEKVTIMKEKGKRGRRSKDDSLVNQHALPFTAEQLSAMPYRDYAALMQDASMSNEQKALIKKIRRRGRNKLAARKCRERRLNNGNCAFEDYDAEEEEEEQFDKIEEGWDDAHVEVVDVVDGEHYCYPSSSSTRGADQRRQQHHFGNSNENWRERPFNSAATLHPRPFSSSSTAHQQLNSQGYHLQSGRNIAAPYYNRQQQQRPRPRKQQHPPPPQHAIRVEI